MRIAVIAPTSIPAKRANTLQVMKMTQALVNLEHQVQLIAPKDPGRSGDELPVWEDIAHYYGLLNRFPIEYMPVKPSFRKYDYALQAVRWARGWSADIIYTRLPQAAALASYQGYGTILEIHDIPKGSLGPILFRRFFRGKGAKRLVVISESLAADLHKEFKSPEEAPFTQILPDGVDLNRFVNLADPKESRRNLLPALKPNFDEFNLNFSTDRITVGYTGHLYPGRGAHVILELAKRLPEVNFLIVGGESKDVNRVKGIANEYKLQNMIITGFVPNAELPLYQAACDILLMPYQRKVAASSGGDIARYLSPMKLFEYMACGRAICSSDLPVLREILSEEIAMLLPPEDIESWVAAVRDLRDNPTRRKRLANRAQETVAQYSWDTRAQKILEGI